MLCATLLCMLEAMEGRLLMGEALEVMCRVLCMLEAVEGGLCLLEVSEVIRCVLSVCWRLWRAGS